MVDDAHASNIYWRIVTGRSSFQKEVVVPFRRRDLARAHVMEIVGLGLHHVKGDYHLLSLLFGISHSQGGKKLKRFLDNHGCYIPGELFISAA